MVANRDSIDRGAGSSQTHHRGIAGKTTEDFGFCGSRNISVAGVDSCLGAGNGDRLVDGKHGTRGKFAGPDLNGVTIYRLSDGVRNGEAWIGLAVTGVRAVSLDLQRGRAGTRNGKPEKENEDQTQPQNTGSRLSGRQKHGFYTERMNEHKQTPCYLIFAEDSSGCAENIPQREAAVRKLATPNRFHPVSGSFNRHSFFLRPAQASVAASARPGSRLTVRSGHDVKLLFQQGVSRELWKHRSPPRIFPRWS
ncbi:MAG: hypothetical protein M3Y23_05480 [Actinomycetota bacterium]|nr:hypothetical protein [Actinomycetota bacterium]